MVIRAFWVFTRKVTTNALFAERLMNFLPLGLKNIRSCHPSHEHIVNEVKPFIKNELIKMSLK